MARKVKPKTWLCGVCKLGFDAYGDLRAHARAAHPKTPVPVYQDTALVIMPKREECAATSTTSK